MAKKNSKFFASYFFKLHLNHFLRIESQKEVTKQLESRFFLLFLLDEKDRDPDPYLILMDPHPYLILMDPDPDRNTGTYYFRTVPK